MYLPFFGFSLAISLVLFIPFVFGFDLWFCSKLGPKIINKKYNHANRLSVHRKKLPDGDCLGLIWTTNYKFYSILTIFRDFLSNLLGFVDPACLWVWSLVLPRVRPWNYEKKTYDNRFQSTEIMNNTNRLL